MVVSARAQGLEASEARILRALLRVGLQHPGAFDQVRALLKQNERGLERQEQAPRAGDHEENPVRTFPSGSGAA